MTVISGLMKCVALVMEEEQKHMNQSLMKKSKKQLQKLLMNLTMLRPLLNWKRCWKKLQKKS